MIKHCSLSGTIPLVDKLISEDGIQYALSNISMSQDFFQGHFPNNPVMPGVLIIQAMAEACQLMKCVDSRQLNKIRKARFREMVRPGDQLKIAVEEKEQQTFLVKAYCNEKVACSAELTF